MDPFSILAASMTSADISAKGGLFIWRKIQARFPEVRLNKWKARVYVSLKNIDELQCKERLAQADLDEITLRILLYADAPNSYRVLIDGYPQFPVLSDRL